MEKRKLVSLIISGLLAVCMIFTLAACTGSESGEGTTPAGSGSEEAGTTSDLFAVQEKGTLVVGVTDFPPMDYQENGKWVGFDAELSEIFADSIGVEVEFIEIDWDNKILELNAGSVDCIWNGMTLTPEVAEAMSCSDTYA